MITPLSPEQRLERLLSRLGEIGYWRVRSTVDVPDWACDGRPLAAGQAWPTRTGVLTFTHPTVQVPADWPLEESRLELDFGGEGLVRLSYDGGGQEAFGLDPHHQRFPLQGRSFSVEVSAVARLPFGQPSPDPRLRVARLILLDPAVEAFERRLRLLIETTQALAGHEATTPLLIAAEEAFTRLEFPSATVPYVSRLAASPQLQEIWQLPDFVGQPSAALTPEEDEKLLAAAELLRKRLVELREHYPKRGSIALSGHAHIDLAWLWPLDETRRKAQRTFSTALSLMERYPEFRFNQSTAQLYAFVEEDDPALFAKVKEKVASGQWDPVGGMWVEPDLNMPTGESLVRQLLYGQRFFESRFGRRHQVAWLPDCFGFSPALPQILRGAGISNFFTIKLNWSEANRFPYDLFWWEGLDGSRVLAHLFDNPASVRHRYLNGYNGDPNPNALLHTWQNFKGKYLHDESLLSVGYGDGGGGPTDWMLEDARLVNELPVVPSARFALVGDFFAALAKDTADKLLPRWVGELYLELHRGTLTSQGRVKRLHRQAERALITAEAVDAMAALLSGSTPSRFEPLWQLHLRNEFHDILPGSGVREVYEVTEKELGSVIERAGGAAAESLGRLRDGLAGGPGKQLFVVNPSAQDRPLRVELTEPGDGTQQVEGAYLVSSGDTVPGLAAAAFTRLPAPGELAVSETQLENAYVRVVLDEHGRLASFLDKRAGREVLAGPGNQVWAYVDKPRQWDAWDIDADYALDGEELLEAESIEVLERGPHRVAVRIRRRFRGSSLTQDVRLWANSPRLDFRTTIDWHDRRWLLKARFPLAVRADHATFETAFGVIRRPTHRNTTWEAARFEVAGHRFADLSEPGFGAALLNDGRYGHHAIDNELGLSLLRSPIYPDPLADEGSQVITYSLYPHLGGWHEGGVLAEAEDLNAPLLATRCAAPEPRTWKAVELGGLGLGLGALKAAEDGEGLVLRLYEPQGARGAATVTLPSGWRLASELNLLEDALGEPDLQFSPFQVHTWLVGGHQAS